MSLRCMTNVAAIALVSIAFALPRTPGDVALVRPYSSRTWKLLVDPGRRKR